MLMISALISCILWHLHINLCVCWVIRTIRSYIQSIFNVICCIYWALILIKLR